MGDPYDAVVIGAGPAGEQAAGRLADSGLTVAIGQRRLVGGECSCRGCIPSKTLIRPGHVLAAARRAADAIAGRDVTDMPSASIVSRVTFTDPQVCAVGHTEATARSAGLNVTAVTTPTGCARRLHPRRRHPRHEPARHRRFPPAIVVATFTGPGVQELLHSATVAICSGAPVERLWHAVPSFPALSEVWLYLLEAYGLQHRRREIR